MVRRAAVAGMFYDGEKQPLVESVEKCFLGPFGPGALPRVAEPRSGRVMGLVTPHAGYVYSGGAAAQAFCALAEDGLPDVAVFLGPNHHGRGEGVAVNMEHEWETPLGTLHTDMQAAADILRLSLHARADDLAHAKEHSIEVQLPFLQYIAGDGVKIVSIAIAHYGLADALEAASDLGSAIAQALQGKSAVVIASTDFSHYESKTDAEAKDSLALEQITRLDGKELLRVVHGNSISMCGAIGTAVMLHACSDLGATKARRLTYYTSGDVTGDPSSVVGYAAVSVGR